jgi:hypothetical protein
MRLHENRLSHPRSDPQRIFTVCPAASIPCCKVITMAWQSHPKHHVTRLRRHLRQRQVNLSRVAMA